ncbi:hypothetical protein CV133_gene38 [Chlorobiaceae phage CV-1-33]|nr:hypothetical protein CV133_gene38 [Chlorobiaceae phage CV-1-33]
MDVMADTNPTTSDELDESTETGVTLMPGLSDDDDESTETGVTLMPGLSDDDDESEGDALATIAEASVAVDESAGLSVSLPAPVAVIWIVNELSFDAMLPKLPGVSEDDGDDL